MDKEVLGLLLGIGWLIVSFYIKGRNRARAKQKIQEIQQKKNEAEIPLPIPSISSFEEIEIPQIPTSWGKPIYSETNEEIFEEEGISLETITDISTNEESYTKVNTVIEFFENKEVKEDRDIEINHKFDLREAIIYQTILEKKYS